ncbi:hypothetical protein, partial [Streptomyces sp. SID13726]|uniref:hypothetical protein n=1 Tax=Streptomyces sp. SID13726 TaxID=2706058 RepID=UPI0013BB4546
LPLHSQGTETPFSAIGSARVGLGRDRFADYASEHLARSAVERLVKQHETLRRTDDDRPEKQLVRDTADDVFPGFLRQSRLHERGEENNHLIDALRPAGQTADAEALTAQILTRIKNEIPAKGEKVDNVRRAVVNA